MSVVHTSVHPSLRVLVIEDAVHIHTFLGYEQRPQNGPCELFPVCFYEAKNNELSSTPQLWQNLQKLNTPSPDFLARWVISPDLHVSLLWRLLDEVHGLKIKQNLASLHAPTFSTKPWQPHTQFLISFHSGFPPVFFAFNLIHNQYKYFLLDLILCFVCLSACLLHKTKLQAILKVSKYNGPARIPPELASLARKSS